MTMSEAKLLGILARIHGMNLQLISVNIVSFDMITNISVLLIFPLGYLLWLRMDYLAGAAILVVVFTVILGLPVALWPNGIGLGTACILWLAGWGRLLAANGQLREI